MKSILLVLPVLGLVACSSTKNTASNPYDAAAANPYAAPTADPYAAAPYQPINQVNEPYTPSAPAYTPSAPSTPAAGGGSHTVVAGDTLWGLSRRYGTTVEAIQAANGISGTNIRTGQTLNIPR